MRGGKPFWKKGLPPRAPPFQKLLPLGLCEDGRICLRPEWFPCPKVCTRAAWKSVPFEGRRRWRKGAKRNSWGMTEAIPGQPCQLVQTFRYVSRERWAPVLRIPCPFLGAVRLADLPCVLWSAAGRSAYRCRFRWFCSWGSAGACGSRSLHSRRYQRAHEAGTPACITVCCHRRTG